jgi:heptosyltransferase-2
MACAIERDCFYFRGDLPCIPHKETGARCRCDQYRKRGKRILIIKLGAAGDVIRTTPVLRKLKSDDPEAEITWITHSPGLLPRMADVRLDFTARSLARLLADRFDLLLNFDKDPEACGLANIVKAGAKKGFCLKDGRCAPIDKDAEHKFLTGLDDSLSKANRKTYPEEMFEIAGLAYSREPYVFDKPPAFSGLPGLPSPVIGLNTGCGSRWPTRLWPIERWVSITRTLHEKGFGIVLLGGPDEEERNKEISRETGAFNPGAMPLSKFISLIDSCDLVVTGVTMAQHIAIGLGKKIVLFNNIFNRHEFELYGRGEIIEPPGGCRCYYKSSCDDPCMPRITVESVVEAVERLVRP